MTPEEFGRECAQHAKYLRRLPADLRRALAARTKTEVALPLADDIRQDGGRTPYARRLAGNTVKVRANANPTIVVGGQRKVASGGASGRQLIHGTHWGGGERVTAIPAKNGRAGYRRHTTRQFRSQRDPFVFRAVYRNIEPTFLRWASIVDDILNRKA